MQCWPLPPSVWSPSGSTLSPGPRSSCVRFLCRRGQRRARVREPAAARCESRATHARRTPQDRPLIVQESAAAPVAAAGVDTEDSSSPQSAGPISGANFAELLDSGLVGEENEPDAAAELRNALREARSRCRARVTPTGTSPSRFARPHRRRCRARRRRRRRDRSAGRRRSRSSAHGRSRRRTLPTRR